MHHVNVYRRRNMELGRHSLTGSRVTVLRSSSFPTIELEVTDKDAAVPEGQGVVVLEGKAGATYNP